MQPEPIPHVGGQGGVRIEREFIQLHTHLLHTRPVLRQLVRKVLLKILETYGLHAWHTYPKLVHRLALVLDIRSVLGIVLGQVDGLCLKKLQTPVHLAQVLLPESLNSSQREMIPAVLLVDILAQRPHEYAGDTVVLLGWCNHLLGDGLLGGAGPNGHAFAKTFTAPFTHHWVVGKLPGAIPHNFIHRTTGVYDVVLAAMLVDSIPRTHAIDCVSRNLLPPPSLLLDVVAEVVQQFMGLQKSRLPNVHIQTGLSDQGIVPAGDAGPAEPKHFIDVVGIHREEAGNVVSVVLDY
mmetsp:Transcript_33765/g.75460  ORF Transcript_33765/g.75460 Transcript_33765/m.75460 type:complete len:293 (-) Transcript_33765:1010-1888(-)